MQNKRLVVFDFDGVIVNTIEMSFGINQKLRPQMSREEYLQRHEGNVIRAFADTVADSYRIFFGEYTKGIRNHEITPEIGQLIKDAAALYPLTIVSSTPAEIISQHLQGHGLRDYFGRVLGGETHEDKTHKLLMLSKESSVLPADMVYITDTLGDIREAEKAGVPSIAVTWGYHPAETLARGNPAFTVRTPAELLRAITNGSRRQPEESG